MGESKLVARQRGEGRALWVLGGLYEVKVSSEETNNAMTVMEMTLREGMGPPPHTHPGAETVYVLEGAVSYHIGDETIEGGPGSIFQIPEGTWEWFEPAATPTRLLVIYAHGGMDKFFAEVGEPAGKRELPPPAEAPPNLEAVMAAASRYGMQIKPPPGA